MSKIDELIAKYCPNGVEFKELGEVCEVGTGSSNGNEATENGKYPLFVRSKFIKKISTFEFDEEAIIIPGEGGIGEIFHYINGKYALHQRAYRIHFNTPKISTKFAYYYLFANFLPYILKKSVNATVKSIRKPMIEKFQIPIPPLPVQQEIVNILDKFTELEKELEEELKARHKQYEYYRNRLLSATEVNGKWLMNGVEVEWKTLGEVCNIADNKRKPIKSSLRVAGTTPYYGANNIQDYVDGYTHDGEYVLLAEDGSTSLKNYSVQYATGKFWANNHVHVIKGLDEVLNRFLFHWFRNMNFIPFLSGGTRAKLTKAKMLELPIPIPPLSEQERIVEILDKFDSLVNDISIGLPAEIEARRKQYEYYRSKLLSFKPK